jgi:channel protein (hemolysin III family)
MHYNESPTKPWWYPRHPGVTILDSIGCLTTIYWLHKSNHWTTDGYLLTLLALYIVSGLYHHVIDRVWLRKLDHAMIFYIIAITALPYWGHILPFTWYDGGPLLIIVICVLGSIIKLLSFLPRHISGLAYILAAAPMVSYFIVYRDYIPQPQQSMWLFGIVLYALQLSAYTFGKPDLYPEKFGYREVQHIVLLCATNLHSWIAISLA